MKYLMLSCLLFTAIFSYAQTEGQHVFRFTSSYTSFPDTARQNGHTYNKVLFDAATHYRDSSVIMIVPDKLDANKKVDLIFWFHGWGNNIDTAIQQFELARQFAAAKLNAVLVLAETAKNASDSYGGKLETDNMFKGLVGDILQQLKKEKAISKKCEAGNILLAGHSGAYRVMAFILAKGNVPVQQVILFDALYGQTDKYMDWIKSDNQHRLINIYTDGGGTDGESKAMVQQLANINIKAIAIEENELTPPLLKESPIVFIHSLHRHNDVIKNPDNFQLFLGSTPFFQKLK